MKFFKIDRPIELSQYVRLRRRRSLMLRGLGALLLLLSAIGARAFFPAGADRLRYWVTGGSEVNDAVAAFYACIDEGSGLPEAVEAFCYQFDD